MKPSAKASGVAARKAREPPRTPVSFDDSEKKTGDEDKTKDAVERTRLSRLQGARGSIPSLSKSSPYESSLNAAHRRASSGQTMLSDDVLERMHSLADEGVHQEKVNGRWLEAPRKPLLVCAVVAIVLIAVLAALLFRHRPSIAQRLANDSPCNSAGCQRLVSEVIDPAFSLYSACLAPAVESVSQLKAFMKGRGLSWPKYGTDNSRHALYVMFDLLINWGVQFWFELSLRRLPNDTRYSLYVNRIPMNKWRRQQQVSVDLGRLKEYAKMFYDVYGASKEDRSHIDRLLKLGEGHARRH
ncbi:hypothetical protein MTO96_006126 [Rhipicephalus appendiculatus]